MNVLVTGAKGFIGQNLCVFLNEAGYRNISTVTREDTKANILAKVKHADFIFHLAGVNRPENELDFKKGNTDLTALIINELMASGKKTPIVLSSSIQASVDNAYGVSKAEAENIVKLYQAETGAKTYIYRLPNVFGKWCRPNYNSAIATFCHNTINNLPITINNAQAALTLVYIDDVCKNFMRLLDPAVVTSDRCDGDSCEISPTFQTSVGEVVELLKNFKNSRDTLITERVGSEFLRALYSTYVSYLKPEQFSYPVTRHTDARGTFVEMLKTQDSGQFSFFTAHPGITRGGHYHHTKTEKFLVIKGKASFKFRHIASDEFYELLVDGDESSIVETAPGWSHDITNIGDDDMIVMLWANEIFDRENPDTVNFKI